MSEAMLERIIEEVKTLGAEDLLKVQEQIDKQLKSFDESQPSIPKSRITGSYVPKDRTKENEWLRQHRHEYAGQWVALDGERLLGHGHKLKDVAEAVKQSGVTDALYIHLEPSDALPWTGF